MTDNETLVRDLFRAWNDRDYESIAGSVAEDCTLVEEGSGRTLQGPKGFTQLARAMFDAMPDGRFTLDHLTSQGDTVVVEYTGSGTQTGDLVLHAGTVPATGRQVTVHACDIYEVENNKIKEGRVYLDTGAIMSQLGLTEQLRG
ncbi:ester cyclase [Streptomyces sp. ME18-1-4]|uniref:ester cyclase n=1 Tax=Streptomyces sp. ME18-1-4 TaxID=3028685 RepID=UPI0029A4BDAB|nr:ester cyclase [Streptomyces sp. ME18-1-4]MDX3241820.1 ester cyclase [Streptomyces sp. ME18-1-4]